MHHAQRRTPSTSMPRPCGEPSARGVIGFRPARRVTCWPLSRTALDIDRFEHAARDGRAELASGRPDAAVARLSDALAFWRGSPLADVPWERFADAEVRRLEMLRLATEEDRVEATLQLGDAKSAAADAEELVAGDPLREHRWILLMRALYVFGPSRRSPSARPGRPPVLRGRSRAGAQPHPDPARVADRSPRPRARPPRRHRSPR